MPRRPHTILVVDDEPDVVASVQDLLHLEYRVLGATSAAGGESMLAHEEVHVVMTDQRMPGMSGVEFLDRVRGDHPDAVRLLFTGYADIRAVIEAINHGNVYRYITKPWDPDELQTIIRDATERYDMLVERKQLLGDLQRSNAALELKNQQLVEANALKTAFIRVASHELRTPLMVLVGLAELSNREAHGEPLDGYLERIEGTTTRLRRLVDQITTMLGVGEFSPRLDRRDVAVAALARDAADDVRPFLERRRQRLDVDVPGELAVSVDPTKIRDALEHLLLNAIKFTPDGGRIALLARRSGDNALLSVRDEGVGIDAESLPRVFEPFFTGFDSLHHSSGIYEFGKKGLGLGLPLVRAFVEMHGGRVDADSQPGKGSTFTLTLPLHGRAA